MEMEKIKKTLLLVDDEPDLRALLRTEFEFDGFHVIEAGDGHEALKLLASLKVDVVLTDIAMPVMNGLELAHCLQIIPNRPKLFLMSGVSEFDAFELQRLGANKAFPKPFDFNDLVETIIGDSKKAAA